MKLAAATIIAAAMPNIASADGLSLGDCRIESTVAGGSLAAQCGTLLVPENRGDPRSRKIGLHVAVMPALRVEPLRDPLFVIAGGPGQGASDFYASMSAAFARIRRDREIVLVDQRGTGRSNRLDCAFDDGIDMAESAPEHLANHARACLTSLKSDVRFYTTSIAVRDLDEVRRALGYERINFYAVSYGTRVAQHYLRRYPGRVRALVLDGVVPVDLALGPDIALQAQRALDALFERCSRDADCGKRFPDIRRSWAALRERLQRQPLEVELPDPLTAELTKSLIGVPQLSTAVRLLTYADETASVLPLLIHRAQVDGQPQSLAAQYLMIKRNTETQIAYGMHFAVTCSEDAPRWDREQVADDALAATYLGKTFMQGLRSMCSVWPRGPVDEDFNAPLTSAAPVLLLSGENDPVTSQEYGERALRGYTNGRHIVVSGQGHGQLANGCMPRVVADFIQAASTHALDARCATLIKAAPFMLNTSATAP